jgi:DNA (cytosine-5)-methyltransferase 1
MRYLSVCSGIEAATVAWHPLGWKAAAYSEIEKFPSQVLAHHYPNVPNVGDMTKFKEWKNVSNVDVLVGGTPCQSFSVAGLRKGLDDPRGNLMLTYLAIAAKFRPKWLVWENVPGVLSSNGGLDFASLLRGMGECGYGFAYRILDAQYFGVAQRRKRVFVVGCLGDWRAAAAVLFERHSLSGYPAPSREKRKSITASVGDSTQVGGLCARTGLSNSVQDAQQGHLLPIPIDMMNIRGRPSDDGRANRIGRGYGNEGDPMFTITKANHHGVVQPIAFSGQMSNPQTDVGMTQTLQAKNPMAVAFGIDLYNGAITGDVAVPMTNRADGTGTGPTVMQSMAVRRLTPVECERLQGFPNNYTNIKDKCPDGPRYKALGNSMAVPVMAWIGKRIQEVENL